MSDNDSQNQSTADGAPDADEVVVEAQTTDDAAQTASDASAADASPVAEETDTATDEADAAPVEDSAAAAAKAQADAIARISALETDIIQLTQEKQDNWNRYLRATADVENVRRRAKRDVEDTRIEARSKVLKEMLPVIDNLERALEHAEKSGVESGADGGVLEGVKLVLRQFAQALERCNVTPVEAVGQPFDPNLHEAISQIVTDEVEPGAVVQALQRGYSIGGRLLRPALVVVAKAPPAPPPPEDPPEAPSPAPTDDASEPAADDVEAVADDSSADGSE